MASASYINQHDGLAAYKESLSKPEFTSSQAGGSLFKHYKAFNEQSSHASSSQQQQFLSNAMSMVNLVDKDQESGRASQPLQSAASQPSRYPKFNRLELNLCSQPSQEMLCTPEFASLQEQQFLADYECGKTVSLDDGGSRSPAPSPQRLQKRPRQLTGDDNSDSNSQASQPCSQTRSQGDPSTTSTNSAPTRSKPPKAPSRPIELPCIRNPYLTPGTDKNTEYHPSSGSATSLPSKISRLSADYKSGKEIGRGNFSIVLSATHRMSGKTYAIKRTRKPIMMLNDRNTWLAEVQAFAAVEGHPNIVTFYDSWAETDQSSNADHFFIRLELCGTSLKEHVASNKGYCWKETELLDLTRQMAAALKHVHDLGIAHLDVKPDNIFKSITGNGIFKLGDFGNACPKDGSRQWTEGDSRYLSPEMLHNKSRDKTPIALDKADIFALGAMMYELASGTSMPTGGERYQALRRGDLTMLPHISVKLQQLIKRMMASDPKLRPTAEGLLKSALVQTVPLTLSSSKAASQNSSSSQLPPSQL
ncbi:MAG: hypothetical protein WDW38_003352 [Sanguina aurantia]